MKHIIIAGGSGFIGSHLCDAFLGKGFAVTAVDNFVTGQRANLTEALLNPEFELLERDICHPIREGDLKFLSKYGLYGVLNFACPASPIDFDRIPFEILKVSSLGTMRTVDLAERYKACYLLASTSEVYGDPLVHPQVENYRGNVNTVGPRACYDEGKRFAEAYVSSAIRSTGLAGRIVRIFNTYGPRMRASDGRIVPELCSQALWGRELTVHGDGKQTRSFCYVSDLVDGIIRLFESNVTEPVNIGNPEERSVNDFANAVFKLTSSTSRIRYIPGRPDDPQRRCPDITRARELLGWSCKVGFEEGLGLTLDYFRKNSA